MDIVYPLGSGSQWNNNEIRYSLRSIDKYGSNVGNVYVIGERPPVNVIHIPFVEQHKAAVNVWNKVLTAVRDDRISDRFLWFNDDIFMLRPFNTDFPYYHKGDIASKSYVHKQTSSTYRLSIKNTLDALRKRGLPTSHFGVHCPIVIEKDKFLEIDREFPEKKLPNGVSFRSIYCNYHGIEGTRHLDRKTVMASRIAEWARTAPFFSTRANFKGDTARRVMDKLYPVKSRWEKP